LDPNQVREVRALIKELATDHTVLLSTHILSEVEATCQRALVIDRGRLIAQGTLAELSRGRRTTTLLVVLRDAKGSAAGFLGEQAGVAEVTPAEGVALEDGYTRLRVSLNEGVAALSAGQQLLRALVTANHDIASLAPESATLEQVFAELTRDDASEAP
jgi:ABC-2 type transport system ATP-binding protein